MIISWAVKIATQVLLRLLSGLACVTQPVSALANCVVEMIRKRYLKWLTPVRFSIPHTHVCDVHHLVDNAHEWQYRKSLKATESSHLYTLISQSGDIA